MVNGRLEWDGVAYEFAPVDSIKVREVVEDWMKEQARAEVELLKNKNPRLYAEEKQELRRDISAKLYVWGGPIWQRHFETVDGVAQILRTQIHVVSPTQDLSVINRILAADPEDVASVARSKEAIDHMLKWGQDPNSKRAAAK